MAHKPTTKEKKFKAKSAFPAPPTVPDTAKPPVDWDARKTVFASYDIIKAENGQTTMRTKFEIVSFDGREPKLAMRTWKESQRFSGPTGEGGSWTWDQLEELKAALEHMSDLWSNIPSTPTKGGRHDG